MDINYKLATGIDLSATVTGAGVSMAQGGALEGLKAGLIVEAMMIVNGAIDDTTGNETMQVFIEEYDGTNWRTVAVFPTVGDAADDNPDVDNAGRALKCFFCPSYASTQLRYRTIAAGTTPSLTNVDIWLHPTEMSPPI